MALDITYYEGADKQTGQCYGRMVSRAIVTLTGSSASLGVIPDGAAIARFTPGEACVISNNNTAPSDTNGQALAQGVVIDLNVPPDGKPFLGKTA